jgi:hypothetical protein
MVRSTLTFAFTVIAVLLVSVAFSLGQGSPGTSHVFYVGTKGSSSGDLIHRTA